jgi:hypothetical protein
MLLHVLMVLLLVLELLVLEVIGRQRLMVGLGEERTRERWPTVVKSARVHRRSERMVWDVRGNRVLHWGSGGEIRGRGGRWGMRTFVGSSCKVVIDFVVHALGKTWEGFLNESIELGGE